MTRKHRMPHITIITGGQRIPGLPFQGELMTCYICGAQHRSDPKEESNWTCFQHKGKRAYMCPTCWSPENLDRILRYLVTAE